MGSLLILYLLGFMAIGGEWFQMWRDGAYNAQEPVFRFIVCIGIAILIVNQPGHFANAAFAFSAAALPTASARSDFVPLIPSSPTVSST